MHAHQIMSRRVITVGVDASVADAIATMLAHHISGLPVVDPAGKLVGIVSEGDFIRRAEVGTQRTRGRWLTFLAGVDRAALDFAREHGRKVGEIMTANPITIAEDTPLPQVVEIMEAHKIKRLPVMRDGKIVGMLTRADFLPTIANLAHTVNTDSNGDDQLRRSVIAVMAHAPWRPCALNVSVHQGVVSLRGVVRTDNARKAAIVAAENVPGVKKVEDLLYKVTYPPPEEDYGGGDFVSLPQETSTEDDQPL